MKVKVVKLYISNPNQTIVNSDMRESLTINTEHLVYGLTISKSMNYVQIYHDNSLVSMPLPLFEIIDERASKYWKVRKLSTNHLHLWPEEFYTNYFHEDLFEGVVEVVEVFKKVKKRMIGEFPPATASL